MNKDDVIRLAKEAGWSYMEAGMDKQRLEAFAKLVAEHEREACMELCEDADSYYAIRARGQA